MQVTLNQQDILTAVKVYLDKIMSVPVDVVNLDIKGMRTTEGYTATVDVVLEGQCYTPVVPAVPIVEAVEPDITPVKRHFDGLPTLTSEESALVVEILELVANNGRGVNDAVIKSKADSASANVIATLQANTAYMAVLERISKEQLQASATQMPALNEEDVEVFDVEPDDEGEAVDEVVEPTNTDTKHKVKTGVNFLGEPIYEELTVAEMQEREISMDSLDQEKPAEETVKKGMFD